MPPSRCTDTRRQCFVFNHTQVGGAFLGASSTQTIVRIALCLGSTLWGVLLLGVCIPFMTPTGWGQPHVEVALGPRISLF